MAFRRNSIPKFANCFLPFFLDAPVQVLRGPGRRRALPAVLLAPRGAHDLRVLPPARRRRAHAVTERGLGFAPLAVLQR